MPTNELQSFSVEAAKLWKQLGRLQPLELLASVVESESPVESVSYNHLAKSMSAVAVTDDNGEYEIPIACVAFEGLRLDLVEKSKNIVINGREIIPDALDRITIHLHLDRVGKILKEVTYDLHCVLSATGTQ